MLLEWAAGNLAKKNGRSELGVAFKKPAASHQKKSRARKSLLLSNHATCFGCPAFHRLLRPLRHLPSLPSAYAPWPDFRWCNFSGEKFPKFRGTDSTGGSNREVDLSRVEQVEQMETNNGEMEKQKSFDWYVCLEIFWNCHQPFSAMLYFKDWCGMQQCSPHENTHTEQKRAAGDRRRWCIIMTS